MSATPNGSGASISSKILINFSEAVQPASLAGSINGHPIVPTQIVVQPDAAQVLVDPGELEYAKTYSVILGSSIAAAGDPSTTLGSNYAFSFTVTANTDSKHPTTTLNVPSSSLEAGQTYTISGQASGYVWQRDADNPLELELWAPGADAPTYSGILHPTVIYFPDGVDGYKFYIYYTGTGGDIENPNLMRSIDGVTFSSAGITNPVVTYNFQPPFDTQNLADPEVYRVGNTWMLFYEMEAPSLGDWMGTGGNIALALSTDGKSWEPYGGPYTYDPINPPTDFPANGNPVIKPTSANYRSGEMAVIFKDGLYHMWRTVIEGGLFIDHATATDPRGPWTQQPERLNMGGYEYGPHPDVVYDAARNLYLMLYLIPSGANVGQLGLYTSSNVNGPWTLHPINPIFQAQSSTWEGDRLYHSSMVNVDGQWYLYYTGDTTGANGGPKIGLAREVPGVRRVEISTNGGSTWAPTTLGSDGSWTYSWTPAQAGTFDVKARVIDDFTQGDPTAPVSVPVSGGTLPIAQAPILVITDASFVSNPFASYLTEILKAEGITEFEQVQLGSLMSDEDPLTYLNHFSVVLLAQSAPNTASQEVLSDYVTGGGTLIAMRPDPAMADLFGLTYVNARPEQNLEFFAIDTSTDAGRGIVSGSLQYHGVADNYTVGTATSLAYLWNSISTPSSNPAVTIRNVGNGTAVAFTFDLAKSIVMMRQGNPAWKDSEGDAIGGYRPMDMFERSGGSAWWIAGEKMRIPQADEEQRFLANLILTLSAKPLPRMWYLPGEHNSVFVSTGDGEFDGGTNLNPPMVDIAQYGGHYTSYLTETGVSLTDVALEASWRAAGHEVGSHVYGGGPDTCEALAPAYAQIAANILSKFGHVDRTARSHTIDWCGWSEMAEIEANNGTELDTNYYHYNSDLLQYGTNANGYFTGSGMPQPFMNEQGKVLSIYQATTEFADEWFADTGQGPTVATQTIENMMQAAENGNYSAFVSNIHHVRYTSTDGTYTWANNIWAYAQAHDIPLWSAENLLDFVKARNASRFDNITFGGSQLSFDFVPGAARSDLSIMIPVNHDGNDLLTITVAGQNQTVNTVTVKGLDYARFAAPSTNAQVVATYGVDSISPIISAVQATAITDVSASITWQTDELSTSRVDYGTDAGNLTQNTAALGNATSHVVALSGLSPLTTYYYRVSSVDRAGNAAAVEDIRSFTTGAARWVETTAADFSDGNLTNAQVTTTADGEIVLGSGAVSEEFSGDQLDASVWHAGNWLGGAPNVTVSGGAVSVTDGTYIRTNQSYFQKTLEASVTLRSGPNAHFGWADTLNAGDDGIPDPSWIMFTSRNGQLLARTRLNGLEHDMLVSDVSIDSPHLYKIVWNSDNSIEFLVDGVQKATDSRNFTQPFRVYFSSFSGQATSADWVHILGDHAPTGTYVSSGFDAGQPSRFESLTWTGSTPSGTSVAFETRTSDDGTAWGDWQALGTGGAIESPDAQFIQYRISLATSDVAVTPSIGQVVVVYGPAGPDTTDPTIVDVTPASSSTDVPVNSNIVVQFSEPIATATFQATINGTTAFATTFQNGNRVVVLDPNSNFDPGSLVNVSISGSVEDRAGHQLGSPYQWSFTASAQSPAWVETTTADFSDGTFTNILMTGSGNGEFRLDQTSTTEQTQTTFTDDFSGPTMNWESLDNPYPGVDFHLDGGKLVHGALGISYHPALPPGAAPTGTFQFDIDADSSDFWGITWGLQDANHYYMAQSIQGTLNVYRTDNWFYSFTRIGSFPTPGIVSGVPQHIRLVGDAGTYTISVDGVERGTVHDTTYLTGKVGVMGYGTIVTNFDNASLVSTSTTVSPGGSGTYISNAYDAGSTQTWGQLSSTGQTPAGTTLQFATRSSADGTTWSDWADVAGNGSIASPASRYIQYQAQLETTAINVSPFVEDVTVTSSVQPTTHSLTLTVNGNGAVTSIPAGIDCGTSCSYAFNNNTLVTLTATPDAGWTFSGWTPALTDNQITITSETTVTANFVVSNTAPAAVDDSYSMNEDTQLIVPVLTGLLANDTDAENDTLTAMLVNGPSAGTLTLQADGSFIYAPVPNWNGIDLFTYKANDGTLDSNTATVQITVNPVNDAPQCGNVSISTDEDVTGSTIASCTDVENSTLTYTVIQPQHGTAEVLGGTLRYTPSTNYNGSDSFTYTANDGGVNSVAATVNVTVASVNDAPELGAIGNKVVTTGSLLSFTTTASDVDTGDPLTFFLNGAPGGAAITVDGVFSWTPTTANTYTFNVCVSDGSLSDCESIDVTVQIPLPAAFTKLAPGNGATNQPLSLTLYWSASSGYTSYEYCLDTTNDNGCSTSWVSNTTRRSVALSGLLPNTTYYWQVRARNSSGDTYGDGTATSFWSFTTANPPGAFGKLSPVNGSSNLLTTLTLYWTSSSGFTSYEYCIDTTDDNGCSTNWVSNTTKRSIALSGLLPGTTYYWQVRAKNSSGTTYGDGGATSFWSFTTGTPPAAFTKLAPANGTLNAGTSLTLYWTASSGYTSYEYCLDTTNDNGCSTSWVSNTTRRSVTLSGLTPGTTYYWQVRAVNSIGTSYADGAATSFWSFTVGTPPAAFTKLAPANGTLNAGTSLTLYWTTSTGYTSYEYCLDTTNDNACSTGWVSNTTKRSVTLTGLTPGTTYYWQVRAVNSSGTTYANSSGTDFWNFTTRP